MKYRLDRALLILRLLQSDKRYDPVALTTELGVNRRTVYRDIAMLREMGIEVVFNHEFGHYAIERGTGDERHGIDASQLRAAYTSATSNLDESASVESIIRRVAHCLAGNLSPEPGDEDNEMLGGTSSYRPSDRRSTATHSSQVSDQPESESGRTGGPNRVDAATRPYAGRTTLPTKARNWLRTLDYLDLLRHQIECGAIIETCDTDPTESGSNRTTVQRMSLAEFTVNRDGVTVSGLDAGGKSIRSISRSFRVIESGVRDESTLRIPHAWK